MAKAKVNKADVEQLEKESEKMIKKASELTSMVQAITSLISSISSKKNEINDQISQINTSISKISKSIAKLERKLAEVGKKLVEKQADLASTPMTIMTKLGPIPNPAYIALVQKIAALKAYLRELKAMKTRCISSQNDLRNRESELKSINAKLNEAVEELERQKNEIVKVKEKLFSNNQKAKYLLNRVVTVIDRYLSVRAPITNSNYIKSSIVQDVDSGKLILGENGSFWTKEMGNYGEMRTSTEFQKQGFMEMTKSPTSLNDKLKHGIDHIFYKDDKFYIVDSKSGPGAHLESKTATGPQLSDAWIDARLDGAIGKEAADIIREKTIIDSESIIRLVSRVDVGKQTVYGLVDSFGKIIKEATTINELFI